jgi:NADPH:quinone reductase-like Zn-dependent oxidoreductase
LKAYVIRRRGVIDDIETADIAPPALGPAQVRVKVRGAALNPADLKVISGKDGGKFVHSGRSPIALGFDFSGTIEEIDANAGGPQTGQEVYGHLPYSTKTTQGSFADWVVIDAASIAPKPATLTHAEAAALPTAASTALQSLETLGAIAAGQKVLVNGASGGVGGFAIQIARSRGAESWGFCSAASRDHVASLGGDHVLDYRATALGDLDQKFDIILDAVANASFIQCTRLLAPEGVYITTLPSLSMVLGKIQALFSARRCEFVTVASVARDLAKIAGWIDDKTLIPNPNKFDSLMIS